MILANIFKCARSLRLLILPAPEPGACRPRPRPVAEARVVRQVPDPCD